MKSNTHTSNSMDAHPTIPLSKDLNSILEGLGSEQQRRDIVEHDPCASPTMSSINQDLTNPTTPEVKKTKRNREPGLGKCGTTRIAADIASNRGSVPFSSSNIPLLLSSLRFRSLFHRDNWECVHIYILLFFAYVPRNYPFF